MITYQHDDELIKIRIDNENRPTGDWIEIAVSSYGVVTFRGYSDGGYLGIERRITGESLSTFLDALSRADERQGVGDDPDTKARQTSRFDGEIS